VSAPAPRASIAILALTNASGDPEREYFADGLTEYLQRALVSTPLNAGLAPELATGVTVWSMSS